MDENKKNLIKVGVYLGALIILIVFFRLFGGNNNSSNVTNNKEVTETVKEETILSSVEKINSKYYKSKVHVVLDDDAQTIEYEKKDNILIGNKKYHNESINFINYNENNYTYNEEEIIRLDNFDYFDFDKTFIDLDNFKTLIKLDSVNNKYSFDGYEVYEFTYDMRDVLRVYNNINDTNYVTLEKKDITLKVYSNNNKIEYMILDLTNVYNFINETELNEISYKLTFEETKEEDTSWLIEKLK